MHFPILDISNIPMWVGSSIATAVIMPFIFRMLDKTIVSILAEYFPKYFESIVLHIFEELNKWIEKRKARFPRASQEFESELISLTDKIREILKK